MKKFDDDFFDALIQTAAASPRRRTNKNLHNNYSDPVQRLFIAMMPDSYVRPHRHSNPIKFEFFMVLKGQLDILILTPEGQLIERVKLDADGECKGIEIPPNTWHCTVCYGPVVFVEVKQGPYEITDDKDFASWAPQEGEAEAMAFIEKMKVLKVGESLVESR